VRPVGGGCVFEATAVAALPDSSATVRFGNPESGSPFQRPAFDHDSSPNATDNLIPRTSVISAGGNVTFVVAGFHQVAAYRPGTQPEDITVPPFPPNLFIDDPTNRLALASGGHYSRPVDATGWNVLGAGALPHHLRRNPRTSPSTTCTAGCR
jgi:hypothetical protein